MISDHDPVLLRKIWRIRVEYLRVDLLRSESGAQPPPEMKDMRLEEAPGIVTLFDEYGREAVLAAVREVTEGFAEALRNVMERGASNRV